MTNLSTELILHRLLTLSYGPSSAVTLGRIGHLTYFAMDCNARLAMSMMWKLVLYPGFQVYFQSPTIRVYLKLNRTLGPACPSF